MTDAFELICVDSAYALGRYHNVVLMVYRSVPSAPLVKSIARRLELGLIRFPLGQVLLCHTLLKPGVAEPVNTRSELGETRREVMEFLRHTDDKILLFAVVQARPSTFRSAVLKVLALGVNQLGRFKTPLEVFADVAEAAARSCSVAQTRTTTPLDAKEAMACLERLGQVFLTESHKATAKAPTS